MRALALVIWCFAMGTAIEAGCASNPLVDPYAVESAYGAALLRCVDDARTLAESRACRARVNAEWGVVETVRKDGGP